MADDTRGAQRRLDGLLMMLSAHLDDLALCRTRKDAAGVKRCEWALKIDYAIIRSHCARHDLELPHDVPSESAE